MISDGASVQTLLPLLFLAWLASIYIRRFKTSYELKKLGMRAPQIKTYAPFGQSGPQANRLSLIGITGLDFMYDALKAVKSNSAIAHWTGFFERAGAVANLSYTAELRLMANSRMIITCNPENMKAVLTSQFTDYGRGPDFHEEWKDFLGDSIFTTDGQQWHDARQLIRPMFIRERVSHLDLFERHCQKLISLLGTGDGRLVKFDQLMFQFTLDAATDFLFGVSVDSLGNKPSGFAEAFDEVQRVHVLLSRARPIVRWLPKRKYWQGLKTMDEFTEKYITQALSMSPAELEHKLSKSDTFIHALARYTRDPKVMRDQLTAVLLAGRDTTASSLSWVFLELARNPRVLAKLRAEITQQLGSNGQAPTYQDIKDMKYLTYTINETLRLYPVVPFNVRSALVDTTLPRGGGPDGMSPVAVQKSTPVGYSTLLMHRRRDLYPPLSESFPYDPDHWVPDRWATWTPKSWQYIPFNGGPRICIGQNFALVEMGYTICRILQEYDTIVDYGNKPVLKAGIVLTPAEGVNIGFSKTLQSEKS